MSREYNRKMVGFMQREKIKRMIAWDARQDGCSRLEMNWFDIAIDNAFNIKNTTRVRPDDDPLQEDVEL